MLYQINPLFSAITSTETSGFFSSYTETELTFNMEQNEIWSSYYYDFFSEFPTLGVYSNFRYDVIYKS